MLLAAGLFSGGVGRLQGLGFLPVTDPLWDTSWLLSDRSVPGSFLSGLVGYRAQPFAFEVGAYLLYLVAAGFLLFGHLFAAPITNGEPAAPREPVARE
jgi:high-affinity iron transporter